MPAKRKGMSTGEKVAAGVGAAGLVGAGILARKPGMARTGLEGLNAIRQQLMLSGHALPKSVLGGVGAAGAMSAETRSLRPLKELFSRATVRDIAKAYKGGGVGGGPVPGGTTLPGPTPGRIMGSVDEGIQSALQRAGATADEAQAALLQTPLTGGRMGQLGRVLESPAMKYLVPFRRTPFNQFIEGGQEILSMQHPGVLAGYTGAGAAHGALTEDEQYPVSLPFGVAASGKYGLPYGLGAMAGRALAGGKGAGGTAASVLPVSEYGFEQALTDPLKPFKKPAFMRWFER